MAQALLPTKMNILNNAKLIFPCKVNWDTMSPAEAGRFCSECKKVVQDYTKRSLKDAPAKTFCGSFNPDQISFHTSHFMVANRTALSVSLFTLLGIPATGQIAADTQLPAKFDPALPIEFKSDTFKFSNLHFPLLLEGRLRIRENSLPLQNARLTLLQKDTVIHTTQTDNTGRFRFTLQQNDLQDEHIDIAVFYEGTDFSGRPDSLLHLPLTKDTVKAGNVFALEFMVKPFQPVITGVPQTSMTIMGGIGSYQWPPNYFIPEPLGGTFTIMPNLHTKITIVQTAAPETLTVSMPPHTNSKNYKGAVIGPAASQANASSELESTLRTGFWRRASIATFIAILLGFFLRRKKTNSKPDNGNTE